MKIAVIGAGAVGSLVAGFLAERGVDVTLVAREEPLRVIRENGLLISRPQGQGRVPVRTDAKLTRENDLVLFATRIYDLEQAYQENHSFLENCLMMTVQCGVQGANVLSCHFEPEKIMDSHVLFHAGTVRPGEVTLDNPGEWLIGRPYTPVDERLWDVAAILGKAFTVRIAEDVRGIKWTGLLADFFYGLPALTGKSLNDTYADEDLCRLALLILKEALDIVKTAGVPLGTLPHVSVDQLRELTRRSPAEARGAVAAVIGGNPGFHAFGHLLQGITRGRPSEVDFIFGEVSQVASSLRMPSPLNSRMVDLVHRVEQAGKFLSPDSVKDIFDLRASF